MTAITLQRYFNCHIPFQIIQSIAMATKASSCQINDAPSVRERIEALYNHSKLFEMTAGCPQLGIHETFGREWALCLAHVEGEVHQCGRVVEDYLRKNAQREEPAPSEAEYKSVMNDLVNALLLHGIYIDILYFSPAADDVGRTYCQDFSEDELVDAAFDGIHEQIPHQQPC